jgi:hypothetical protein
VVIKKCALLKKTQKLLNANISVLFYFKNKAKKWNSITKKTSLYLHFLKQHWLKEVVKGKNDGRMEGWWIIFGVFHNGVCSILIRSKYLRRYTSTKLKNFRVVFNFFFFG